MNLSNLSIKRPISALMICTAMLLVGSISLFRVPVGLLPDITFPVLTVELAVPGYSPTEVENRVTKPVEDMVGTMNHVRRVNSTSSEGLSQVQISFDLGTNMDYALAEARDKINLIRDTFPKDARYPRIHKYNPSDAPVAVVSVHGDLETSQMEDIVDERMKGRLERVDGVGNVVVKGGRKREIIVEVDPGRLRALGLSIEQIAQHLKSGNLNLQVGSVDREKSRMAIRLVGRYEGLTQIKKLGIAATAQGSVVFLGDIARVTDSYGREESLIRFQGEPRIMLSIQKESGVNIINLSKKLGEEVDNLKKQFSEKLHLEIIYDQAASVKKAINRVRNEAVYGGLLAIAVIFLFLRNFQSVLIIGVSIPISVMVTFAFMYLFGVTLNVISLSGFTLGVGMLVDNSIVVIENIFKKREKGLGKRESSMAGSGEVLRAIIVSTLAHIAVFLPIIFLQKKIRMLYSGLFFTVSFSLLISLLVAVTIIPLLSSRADLKPLWGGHGRKRFHGLYRRMLIRSLRHRGKILVGSACLFLASLLLLPRIGFESMGQADRDEFDVVVRTPPGTSLKVTDDISRRVEKILLKSAAVKDVSTDVRSETARLRVRLVPLDVRKKDTRGIVEELRPSIDRFAGVQVHFDVERRSSSGKKMIVYVNGQEQKQLLTLAFQVKKVLETLQGITDVVIHQANPEPEMHIRVIHDKAGILGLDATRVAHAVRSRITGPIATEYVEKNKEVDLRVRVEKGEKQELSGLKDIPIPVSLTSGEKVQVPLGELSTFHLTSGVAEIHRMDQHRTVEITAEIGKFGLADTAERVEKAMEPVPFPEGYDYRFGENYREMKKSQKEMLFAFALAVILVYMILASLFESFLMPLTIMVSVPMAVIGSLLALYLFSKPISIPVYVGAITLAGIVVNNGVVLLDYIGLLKSQGTGKWRAIVEGSESRLRPILMTSATTILALLPMAIDRGEGSNLWSPLALTIIGGLLTSTLMTLITLPILYSFVGRGRPRDG